ncbi:hypothetical protein EV05_0662 [Prochlorococcus sp. MIT 0601]|nr:hypothetical protein EV05_0662 [Prochlorococcus sp. MIT 0601]
MSWDDKLATNLWSAKLKEKRALDGLRYNYCRWRLLNQSKCTFNE